MVIFMSAPLDDERSKARATGLDARLLLVGLLDEDRLMRTIRQLVEGLLRARALRVSGQDEESLDALSDVLEKTLGLRSTLVYQMAPETLLSLLSPAGEADVEKLVATGRLLEERARVLTALGRDEEAARHGAQALLLLEEAESLDVEGRFQEHYAGIEALRQQLA